MRKKKPAAPARPPIVPAPTPTTPPEVLELDEVEAGLLTSAEGDARQLEQAARDTRADAIGRVVRKRQIKGPGVRVQVSYLEEGKVVLLVYRGEEPRV